MTMMTMMTMISLIAIFIYLAVNFLYEYNVVGSSTNWSIFYFSITNLSFTLVAFDIILRETSKAIKYTAISMAIYFILLLIFELRLIGVPFDEYIQGVNSAKVNLSACCMISILLIFLSLTAWEKKLGKRS